MGEAKQRSRGRQEVLARFPRCIYCDSTDALTVEHMPPRGVFKNKDRPSGWEFACCTDCNNGTRGVDAVAQFLSLMDPLQETDWKDAQALRLINALKRYAPVVTEELMSNPQQNVHIRHNGILRPAAEMRADGPATHAHLDAFAAKMAMASFATFTGRPLEMEGIIWTMWFLNGGMPTDTYRAVVSMMARFGQLEQGAKVSGEQFAYIYNTDEKSVVAACIALHGSLTMLCMATDQEPFVSAMCKAVAPHTGRIGTQMTQPGRLLDRLGSPS